MSVATNHFSGVMVNTTFSVMDKIIQVKTVGESRCEQIILWKNVCFSLPNGLICLAFIFIMHQSERRESKLKIVLKLTNIVIYVSVKTVKKIHEPTT